MRVRKLLILPLVSAIGLWLTPARADDAASVQHFMTYFPTGDKCIKHTDVNLNLNGRLTGPGIRKLLTPEALAAGVELYITGSDENKFGNVSILYWQPKGECVLWYETISVQEYGVRLGLSPYGISPFYKEAN